MEKDKQAKIAEIAEFTELGDYLYMPTRTYSSGMLMRLAFAVATSIQPEILVMDEIIGAGDSSFLQKARHRLNNLISQSNIVVLASHSKDIIKTFCNKMIVMQHGQLQYFGPIKDSLFPLI